jgi:hypothetical protein
VRTQHRVVVAESFLREDGAVEDHNYSFLSQLPRLTHEGGALAHHDRIDAVAGAVATPIKVDITVVGSEVAR